MTERKNIEEAIAPLDALREQFWQARDYTALRRIFLENMAGNREIIEE